MAKTVNWVIVWEEDIGRAGAIVVTNKVPAGLNLETFTKATTERRMEIVNPTVYDSYDDTLSVVTQRMRLVDTGEDVRAPLAEVRYSSGLNLGTGVDGCNRP